MTWRLQEPSPQAKDAGMRRDIERLRRRSAGRTGTANIIFAVAGPGARADVQFPYRCRLTSVTLLADQIGSVVVDLWKDTFANFPPTVTDTICAAAKPTLSSQQKYVDSGLDGWTTNVNAGDTIRVNVDSTSGITRLCVALKFEKRG